MKKEFLPSKKFFIRLTVAIVLIIVGFLIYKVSIYFKNRNSNNIAKQVKVINQVQDDSNNNGIPDWEERLWGLNPNKDGEANKEFILNKRKTLKLNNGNSDSNSTKSSDNDKLAQEFFAIVMSLQQTGNLDDAAMQTIASAFSTKITAEEIPDKYTENMLNIKADTTENITNYYKDLQDLIKKYKDKNIGDELTFIIQGMAYNDPQVMTIADGIAESYSNFGSELIKLPVPKSISKLELTIANDYEKNAESIHGLAKFFSDPLEATKAIINYKKYNDELSVTLGIMLSVFKTE